MKKNEINQFLYFGYIPKYNESDVSKFRESMKRNNLYKNISRDELINIGSYKLQNAINKLITKNKFNVVPLSGGLDSRAILGGLLNAGLKKNIRTVTFGSPNTYDYEIGNYIANKMNLKHNKINLEKINIDEVKLIKTFNDQKVITDLFTHFFYTTITKTYGTNCVYWSGFMGDPLAGSHLYKNDSQNIKKAKLRFIKFNKQVKSLDVFNEENFIDLLPRVEIEENSLLSYDEQFDFFIRQFHWVKNMVLSKNYEFRTPFMDEDWIEFILNVPRDERYDQKLYKDILKDLHPELFSYPIKDNYGLNINTPKPIIDLKRVTHIVKMLLKRKLSFDIDDKGQNYIDFDKMFRNREDYRNLAHNKLKKLNDRKIISNIDPLDIFNKHIAKEKEYGDAIRHMISLEIILEQKN